MKTKKDNLGGELTDLPNEHYKKFFDKFKEIETLDILEFKPAHLIALFCKKYKDHYNVDYKFKFNSTSPSKCFEVFQIKKLSMMLTSKPNLLRDYIDWIFTNKIIKTKRRVTSISFLTNEDFVKEYKLNVLLNNDIDSTISRNTILPDKYKEIFLLANTPINNYGDLSFLFQMTSMPSNLSEAFIKIIELGFDKSILTKII